MTIVLDYRPQPGSAQPGAAILLEYSAVAGVTPLIRHGVRTPWALPAARRQAIRVRMAVATQLDHPAAAPWSRGRGLDSAGACGWPAATVADRADRAPWDQYLRHLSAAPLAPWEALIVADTRASTPWGRYGLRSRVRILAAWLPASLADIATVAPWLRHAARHGQSWVARTAPALRSDVDLVAPWAIGQVLDAPIGAPIESGAPPTDARGTMVTPSLRSYVVLNEISLIRVSNNLHLPALALSISADVESWTYQWSATLPGSHLDDVLPASPGTPVELAASINGWPHRLLVTSVALDKTHGKPRVQVSGRGLAALLGAPYAAAEARDNTASGRTAAQLCDDALLINGVSASGWTVDWSLTDWLVPAGAWVTRGAPMDAITAIAAAAGGYVRPDPIAKILHIDHRYPVKPWDWSGAIPDYELPAAATTKVGIVWRDNPPYNAVYVAGSGPGAVLGHVKRSGTAGDLVAPMEVDALITHADAARQRGTAILADAGHGQTLTLETPVIESIGPYPVGSLIRFVDGATLRLGIVRGCQITVDMPKVRQTLEVECHD